MRSVHIMLPESGDEEVASFLDTIAQRQAPKANWIVGSLESPVLYIGLDCAVSEFEPENVESARVALGVPPSQIVFADVSGRHEGDREVHEFAIAVMSRFGGVAQDDHSTHSWTIKEIEERRSIDGKCFFLGL